MRDDIEESKGWHGAWLYDGPSLKIEFSRISQTEPRRGVMTLVIDPEHGAANAVAYCFSSRQDARGTINDLARRERMPSEKNIGYLDFKSRVERSRDRESLKGIRKWATDLGIGAAVWIDLPSNFAAITGKPFSVKAAQAHLEGLDDRVRANAMEYVRSAPMFVQTPLRNALQHSAAGENANE